MDDVKVLVTGATGFVAGHCIAELRRHGYQVRGTVRDLRTADVGHLRGDGVEIVAATLDSDAGWAEAVAGCTYVWHVASPFPAAVPKDESELITPAVEGTRRVLRAAAAAGTVRRVVLTSSLAAVYYGHSAGRVFTEADWSEVAHAGAYPKSKTLAERAAWDLARETGLDLVVLNPGSIFGPVLNARRSTSLEVVRRLLSNQLPAVPRIGWSSVDVRDLARAHRLATETPAAAGNRYICSGPHVWMSEIAQILAEEYRPRGYRITTRPLPYWLMRIIALADPTVRLALGFYGREEQVSAAKAEKELGWTMRPIRESILDTAESMLKLGVVPSR